MRKIYIIADFLMTSGDEQDNNIRWVNDFLNRPLKNATSKDIECFSTKKFNVLNFDQKHFFNLSNIDYNGEKQFYFDHNKITSKSIKYLKESIPQDTLFIAYELSEQTRNLLDKVSVHYVDIWLHPIRYMDDVLFGIKSNNEKINSELSKFNISSETYYLYADRLKVQNYRGHRRSNAKVKSNSALFVGQTLNDKAIFHDGKMLNLLDFKETFERIARTYNHVYYSRHPFVKEGDDEIISYIKRFKNVTLNDDPAYHLLASSEIKFVFSISSSVVHEAKYFGKDIQFLHKPVITIGDSQHDYSSVMHELFYGSFWSKILAPIIPTNNLPEVSYFSGKDKTRDALSFYWGYRNIDKIESVKQTVSTLWTKTAKMNTQKQNNKPILPREKTIFESISEKNVISFDIFDTLVTRKTFSPRELFNLIEKTYNKKFDANLKEFKQFRVIAEDKALEIAKRAGKQDCSLNEIYTCLQNILYLDEETINRLMLIEIELELSNIIRRDRGIEIFDYAKSLNKKVILTSDMYLSSSTIEDILNKNDIYGYDKLYVSSEIGLKKKTGDLFKYVIDDNNISIDDLIHIGDNIDGDVKVPESLGIKSYRVPRSIDITKFSTPIMKNWVDSVSVNKTPLLDSIATTISNRFYDDETTNILSPYSGDKFKFGYQAFGPLIVGFTSWIRKTAKEKGINKLYFLSRDTKVVYDCYNILYPNDGIEIKYIYSSRRSVSIPLLESKADLLVEVYKTIYSTTISKWLENKFGLSKESYNIGTLQKHGLKDYDHAIGGKFSKEKLSQLVLDLSDVILKNARKERETLADYLRSNGMGTEDDIAVIDIGYAATMQAAYRRILQKKNIHGLYYATFNTCTKNIEDLSLLNGYSIHLGNPSSPNYGICSHRFFYESIFCDADYSFIRPVKISGGFSYIKTDFDDSVRQAVVTEIHAGVLSLAQDLAHNYSEDVLCSYVDPSLGSMLFDDFLKSPTELDAKIFQGVLFEDAIVPNSRRYLYVPENLNKDKTAISNMIWKEAAALFLTEKNQKKEQIKAPVTINKPVIVPAQIDLTEDNIETFEYKKSKAISIEGAFFKIALRGKKKNKYLKNRELFFQDSNSKFINSYFRAIGKKL